MPPLLGNHQRCWIWGRNVIRETLRAGRWRPYALHFSTESDQEELRALAEPTEIPIQYESSTRLAQRCGSGDHQGAIAKMPPFPYAGTSDLFLGNQTRIVITDHLQDPYNFGAIIRVADCFRATGILIPAQCQVGVTSQVARSSAGAVNHLPVVRSDNFAGDIESLKQHGVKIIAASEYAATPLPDANLTGPLAVVIGNEGVGISPELLDLCDLSVAIPIDSQIGSLNAAVAAGIVLYEITMARGVRREEGMGRGGD